MRSSRRSALARLVVPASVALASAALACGSALDIDALGTGSDAGEDGGDSDAATATGGSSGASGSSSSSSSGASGSSSSSSSGSADAGWNLPLSEDAGAWTPSGWTKMASSSNKRLFAVWGTSSTSVWAGGESGALLHWNGSTWSARASSIDPQGWVMDIAGSAEDDVYLVELRGTVGLGAKMHVHHFDGATWKDVVVVPDIEEIACLHVPTRNVAYVYGAARSSATASAANALRLSRLTGDGAAGLAFLGATNQMTSASGYCSVHAFAPDDVWVSGKPVSRWNGAGFVAAPASPPSADTLSVVSPTLAFTPVHVWNGAAWQSQSTGIAGSLHAVAGRTNALAVGVVFSSKPHVVRYAGGGWTDETLAAGVGDLYDVWMAPNGRTFAVGADGTIVSGP